MHTLKKLILEANICTEKRKIGRSFNGYDFYVCEQIKVKEKSGPIEVIKYLSRGLCFP